MVNMKILHIIQKEFLTEPCLHNTHKQNEHTGFRLAQRMRRLRSKARLVTSPLIPTRPHPDPVCLRITPTATTLPRRRSFPTHTHTHIHKHTKPSKAFTATVPARSPIRKSLGFDKGRTRLDHDACIPFKHHQITHTFFVSLSKQHHLLITAGSVADGPIFIPGTSAYDPDRPAHDHTEG